MVQLRDNPAMTAKHLESWIQDNLQIKVPYMRVFRAMEKALEVLGGNPEDAFRMLPKYKQVIENSNHGSVVELDTEADKEEKDVIHGNGVERLQLFRRFFIGLAGLKKGFLAGCAPFLFFDGFHLRGKYGRVLLSAVGTDPDCGIFPVAYAVVETENKEIWGFFLKCLENFVGPFDDGKPWHFIADRQKGLVPAIEELTPTVVNRKCAKHIYDNFKLKWSGVELRRLYWQASAAFTFYGFNKAMNKMKESSPAAYEYMMNISVGFWARHAYDTNVKIDHVTNNLSESFNSWIEQWRSYSVLNLMEGLRTQIMQRVVVRKAKRKKCTAVLMPRTLHKLNELQQQSRRCIVVVDLYPSYEVLDYNMKFVVNLEAKSCVCRRWDVSGLPCRHAWAAINHRRELGENCVTENHTKAAYRRAYDMVFEPIPSPPFWPQDLTEEECLPPFVKRQPGRPAVNRMKHPSETQSSKRKAKTPVEKQRRPPTCSTCQQKGHTCRKCPTNASVLGLHDRDGAAGRGGRTGGRVGRGSGRGSSRGRGGRGSGRGRIDAQSSQPMEYPNWLL